MDHALLKRQLKRIGIGDGSTVPDADMWRQFLERVSRTYTETDEDRYTLERSLAVSSSEMQQMYESIAGEKRALEIITRDIPLSDALDALLRIIEEQAEGMLCSILLLDQKGTHLLFGAAPSLPEEYNRAVDGIAIGPNAGSCGAAAYRKEAVIVSDIASDPLWADFRDLALSHGLRACWLMPITATNGDILGTFAIYYREPRAPTAQDSGLIERATHTARIAIERSRAQEALSKLSGAVEQTSESLFITDRRGIIEYVNPAFERLSGYSREELIGKGPSIVKSGEHPEGFYKTLWETVLDGRVFRAEVTNKKKNGELYSEEKIITPITDAHGNITHFVSTGRDITQRKLAEVALSREAASKHLLQSAIRSANEAPTLEAALQTVLDMLGDAIGWPVGHAYLTDGNSRELAPVDVWHLSQPAAVSRFVADTAALSFKKGEGLPGRVLATGQPLWIPDLAQRPQEFIRAEAAKECGLRSGFAVPVMASSEVVGVLEFFSAEPATEDASVLELAIHLATGLGRVVERTRALDALRESEERYRDLFENASDLVQIVAPDGSLMYVNRAWRETLGYSEEEIPGLSLFDVIHPDVIAECSEEFQQLLTGPNEGLENLGVTLLAKDGRAISVEGSCNCRFKDGEAVAVQAFFHDVTGRKQAEETIKHLAYHDALTGLPNRALFDDHVSLALAQARRHKRMVAILFLDLDQFKVVNDTAGHAEGDKLLQSVAERLMGLVREGDTVARMGGDEFTLLSPDVEGIEDTAEIAERVLNACRQPWDLGDHRFHVTASIGIAIYPRDGQDAESLLRNADTAMYRAKEQGRSNFQFYTPAMNARIVERLAMENSLRHSLERGEFVVHYQPQVDIRSKRITGTEALVRWQRPECGLVSPAEFIPVAEETGLIVPLGAWVLRTACAQNVAWQQAGHAPMRVAVNLSARQFQQRDLLDMVQQALEETGMAPQHLQLEITEGVAMHDTKLTITTLHRLREMGVEIAIDDFGTGHSSLSYLKRFPIDVLKIDRSFVRDLTADPDDAAIAAAIIAMANSLKLKVIAEGVETEDQLAFLKEHGCDEMQGFLFSKPVPSCALEKMLTRGSRPQALAHRPG